MENSAYNLQVAKTRDTRDVIANALKESGLSVPEQMFALNFVQGEVLHPFIDDDVDICLSEMSIDVENGLQIIAKYSCYEKDNKKD